MVWIEYYQSIVVIELDVWAIDKEGLAFGILF